MLHQQIFGVIAFSLFGLLQCAPQVEWTMYTHNKLRNEGHLVCWTLGGRLASPDSAEDKIAMDYFINNEPWKSKAGYKTLFLDMAKIPTTADTKWNDCGDVFTVWEKSYDPTDDDCTGVLPSMYSQDQKISSAACYENTRGFICEVEVLPICPYEALTGLPTTTGTNYENINKEVDCQQQCTDEQQCRAYVFDTSSCDIYFDADPMVFEDGANIDSAQTGETHYKKCYLSAMVETEPDITSPASFTPFPFTCSTLDPAATVYAVFYDSGTWTEATETCAMLNASIAVFDTDIKMEVVAALLNDQISAFYWVGYQQFPNEMAQWTTGDNLTQVIQAEPPVVGTVSCGATDLSTKEHKLHDCETPLPFICQHTTGQCHFVTTTGYTATIGFVNLGQRSIYECYSQCEARRSVYGGAGCYAFTTHTDDKAQTKDCLTLDFDSWQESFTTASSWISPDSERNLWRFSCITVAKNNYSEIVPPEENTSVSTSYPSTDTSASTSNPSTDTSVSTSNPSTDTSVPTSNPSTDNGVSTSNPSTSTSASASDPSTDNGFSTSNPSTSTSASTSNPSTDNGVSTSNPSTSTSASTSNPSTDNGVSTSNPSTSTSASTSNPSTDNGVSTSNPSTSTSASTSNPSTDNGVSTSNPSTSTSASASNPSTDNGVTTSNPSISTSASASNQPANSSASTSTIMGLALCRCPCLTNISYANQDEFLEELASLRVPAESTGSAYRKKHSIMDDRPTSNGMGTVACIFLGSVLAVVVSLDIITFFGQRHTVEYYHR